MTGFVGEQIKNDPQWVLVESILSALSRVLCRGFCSDILYSWLDKSFIFLLFLNRCSLLIFISSFVVSMKVCQHREINNLSWEEKRDYSYRGNSSYFYNWFLHISVTHLIWAGDSRGIGVDAVASFLTVSKIS